MAEILSSTFIHFAVKQLFLNTYTTNKLLYLEYYRPKPKVNYDHLIYKRIKKQHLFLFLFCRVITFCQMFI